MAHILMAWPITDFDQVLFNDGSGAAEVVAIHLAIKERADATGHALASGDYADEWDGTPVWLGDTESESGRLYLMDVLQAFYADTITMVEDLVWTETIGGTRWTEASLVSDIGMGDFIDLITKPANHEPFLFLHELLDRLIYWEKTVTPTSASGATLWTGSLETTLQDAWDNRRAGSSASVSSGGILWQMSTNFSGDYRTTILDQSSYSFDPGTFSGVVDGGHFQVARQNSGNISFDYQISSVGMTPYSETLTSPTFSIIEIPWTSDELVSGVVQSVSLTEVTSEPSSVPFDADEEIIISILTAVIYINLTSVLTDQS